jgi:hypothetical protein
MDFTIQVLHSNKSLQGYDANIKVGTQYLPQAKFLKRCLHSSFPNLPSDAPRFIRQYLNNYLFEACSKRGQMTWGKFYSDLFTNTDGPTAYLFSFLSDVTQGVQLIETRMIETSCWLPTKIGNMTKFRPSYLVASERSSTQASYFQGWICLSALAQAQWSGRSNVLFRRAGGKRRHL